MLPKTESIDDIAPESIRKEWSVPTLRRLPIAATSGTGEFNEGVGKGKGASGPNPAS
jgi:hypothetical protein